MERKRCQDKQETERTPFDDLSWFGVFIVSLENEIGANIDILGNLAQRPKRCILMIQAP